MASKEIFRPGEKVFYVNPSTGWAIGKVGSVGAKIEVEDGGEKFQCVPEDVHLHQEGSYDQRFDDLFGMSDLHQSTLLYCLKQRYEDAGMMFTRMGEIIISINPFQFKEYNSKDNMELHALDKVSHPHVWEVAKKAYKKITVQDRTNQSILISGESGAGKTETAKTLIDYLGLMSASRSCNAVQKSLAEGVNKKLKASNPILESFGNAKTSRNDNSSRFGKYIKLIFDKESGVLMGAEMVHYLLEKSRIVTQNEGERGYHVFYEFLAGATPEMKAKYGGLTKAEDYACLSKGNQFLRELNGYVTDDKEQYKNLLQAFKDTGITDQEQDAIWRILASILHLQNVKFSTDPSTDKAKIENPEAAETAAKLLNVDTANFKECLLVYCKTKIMTQRADVPQAQDMRDALSKALYSGLFDWLVSKLNKVIKPDERSRAANVRYIGLLDIFGFENFKVNSFEQFCINYTNESLQNHYNKYTFIQDSEECKTEGIDCPIVDYPDNQPCLDMLQKDSKGIMALLDAECAFKLGTDQTFTEKTWATHGKDEFFLQPKSTVAEKFGVRHYAADVHYMTEGWRDKNADTLKDEMREVVNSSTDPAGLVQGLLGPIIEEKPGGKKKPTVSSKFKGQLEQLKEELNSTDSHFIRTVKPNPQMKAGIVNNAYVMTQLTSAGVIETIIMKRQGYPVRQRHKDFFLRYRIIAPRSVRAKYPSGKHPQTEEEYKQVCREIADQYGAGKSCVLYWLAKPTYDIGHTKVFTKAKFNEWLEIYRHRKVSRLMPRCIPFLLRWINAYKEKKARIEEERRRRQEEIQRQQERSAADVAKAAKSSGLGEKDVIFTEMTSLFPHFDLGVILNVVQNAKSKNIAQDFLLDMQRQRVSEALPVTVKALFDEAKLQDGTQEELIKKGVTDREKLFALTPEEMEAVGFSVEERDALAGVLLSQQSNWIINQRLNLLMGAEGRDESEIAEDMAKLEQQAMEIKKDLEGHLAGKYKNVTIRGKASSAHPNPDQITRFVNMGFTKQKAEEALRKAGNNPQKACDLLLSGEV